MRGTFPKAGSELPATQPESREIKLIRIRERNEEKLDTNIYQEQHELERAQMALMEIYLQTLEMHETLHLLNERNDLQMQLPEHRELLHQQNTICLVLLDIVHVHLGHQFTILQQINAMVALQID